jgi:predicted metal-binding membrane protein
VQPFVLLQNWRAGATGALRLGVIHFVDCLGCCVGLMVNLVALGMMNLAWMLTAALISFAEKTIPGRATASPVPSGWLWWRVGWCC